MLEQPDPLTAALAATLAPIVREAVAEALAEHSAGEPPAPVCLTVEQCCAALQVSRATLIRLREQGLPTLWLLDSPRFDLDQVRAWIAQRSAERAGRNASATGMDLFDQWNRSNELDTNKYNADAFTQQAKDQSERERAVSDANTGTHNQNILRNKALEQQHFNNQMAVMAGATGQMNNQAADLHANAVHPWEDYIGPTIASGARAYAGTT